MDFPAQATPFPMTDPTFLLKDIWYFALDGSRLKPGATEAKLLLNQPILFGRTRAGEVFALRDICPHRGVPLSEGSFDGQDVQCPYHGWKFGPGGQCTDIPSLVEGQDFDISKIKVKRYPVREQNGLVWIWMADKLAEPDEAPPTLPELPAGAMPTLHKAMEFPCSMDHAVVGLMDPAHVPFIHRSWYWRTGPIKLKTKAKEFGPSPYGFVMKRHKPAITLAYRILGAAPETEISFRLPGVRVEHIRIGANSVWNFTAVTPIDDSRTEVTNLFFWTMPWLGLLKPVALYLMGHFLGQDRDILIRQQRGLKYDPTLMLIRDTDTQARWYYQLKNEYQRARDEGRAFVNAVKDTVLRWRS